MFQINSNAYNSETVINNKIYLQNTTYFKYHFPFLISSQNPTSQPQTLPPSIIASSSMSFPKLFHFLDQKLQFFELFAIYKQNTNFSLMKDKSKGSDYKCTQVFGYKGSNEKVHEEDIISSMKFDQDGKYLGLGDKAGRIIIFKTVQGKKKQEKLSYYNEFIAYTREFDPLNSSDIDEEVTGITWMSPQGQYQKMLTMNSKNIKLWKIYEKPEKKIVRTSAKQLVLPKFQVMENSVTSSLQKTFPNKHEEDLVGMDVTKNQQYILCSDTVKTILWNTEKSTVPYLVADLQKGLRIEDVKENINCIKLHPTNDSLFAYGTNYGNLVFSDMRISDSYTPLTFSSKNSKQKSTFFSQMISSYSSIAFINNSKYLATRDFLTVKVWDVSKTDKPVLSITLQQSIKSKLCEIFQNQCIYDKFTVSASKDSNTLVSGFYNNSFHNIDVCDSSNTQYELNYKKQTIAKPMIPGKLVAQQKVDYVRKVLVSDFHPKSNVLAAASLNCFLLYSMDNK